MDYKLSILIPTIEGREDSFDKLLSHINNQSTKEIEVITLKDNKDISIGEKRNRLYNLASGKYSVMIDDDDWIPNDYIKLILEAVEYDKDCIGYFERVIFNNKIQKSCISLKNENWITHSIPINGYNYFRSPFFKVPIKTDICKKVGVKDMRYAEDQDFAIRILPHLNSEYFIYKEMYFYTANSLTKQQHKDRYGLK